MNGHPPDNAVAAMLLLTAISVGLVLLVEFATKLLP
jgi:hypothetical protein